jgi:hypothetical protein
MEEKEGKIVQGTAMVMVRRTRIDTVLEDSAEEEVISVRRFETEPAYVSFSVGVTRNQGNYESLRLDVGVKLPCYTEEITEVEKLAVDWADNRMSEKLDELAAQRNAV